MIIPTMMLRRRKLHVRVNKTKYKGGVANDGLVVGGGERERRRRRIREREKEREDEREQQRKRKKKKREV